MNVREDFRRDGLAANFLADEKLIELAAHSLPESLINIGYPAICEKEYEMCSRILHNTKQGSAELCVVGHCREEHIENMARLIEPYDNTSANS